MPDRTIFHMAHAKNIAHRCGLLEGADVLVNLDADNFTSDGFAAWVKQKFVEAEQDSEAIFLGARKNHRGAGHRAAIRTPRGTYGRIACSAEAFRHAGGYDECFESWSPDDKDFGMRLGNLGYNWHMIRPCFLGAIQHGAGMKSDYEKRRRGGRTGEESGIHSGPGEEWILSKREHLGVVNNGRIGLGIVYRNFSNHPIELKSIPTRIFGIGMHRTGTTSLAQALNKIGFDCAHWVSGHWARFIYDEMRTNGRSLTLEMHYALCDLPIPLFYRELDKAYPGSKFILTLRPEEDWLQSVWTHWRLKPTWDYDVASNDLHRALYGTAMFDQEVFLERYRRHNQDVLHYFRTRSDDLLVIDMSKKPNMSQLCRFFGMTVYDAPFPHRHRSSDQEKYR
jgi:Sulfotransferase domain